MSECLCWWESIYEYPNDTAPTRAVCIRWDPNCPTHTTKPRSAP